MEKGKGRETPCSAWAESAAFCRHRMLSNPDATLCLPFLPLPFLPYLPLFLVFSAVSFPSFTAYFDFCQLFLDLPPFFLLSQLLSFRLFLFLTFFILVMFLIVSMRVFLFVSLSVTPTQALLWCPGFRWIKVLSFLNIYNKPTCPCPVFHCHFLPPPGNR